MSRSAAGSWDALRKSFAEQFEHSGSYFTYRQSQKGPAIQLSTDEQRAFVDEFDRNLRRAKWMLYLGLTLAMGGIVLFSIFSHSDLSQAAIFVGIALVMIPYLAYLHWAWRRPAQKLVGRTPIAGPRSTDEVRRLRFQRITYGQLAIAGFTGLALPFIVGTHDDVFSGWHRMWLLGGGALVGLAAVQAFRKWRLGQEDSYVLADTQPVSRNVHEPPEELDRQTEGGLRTYIPFAFLALAVAFVLLTPTGKQLAEKPAFWPVAMLGIGGWSIFTVIKGFSTGKVQPFARGFYNTYDRETQPRRYWASLGWNGIFACLCFWLAFQMSQDARAQSLEDRCYPDESSYSPRDALAACSDWVRLQPNNADAYFDRGLIYLQVGAFDDAIRDLTRAHDLDPQDPWAVANRGLAFAWKKNRASAEADFQTVHSVDPSNPVMLRGEALLAKDAGNLQGAVDRLSESMKRDPDNLWALHLRSELYWDLGQAEKSAQDDRRWVELRRKPPSGSN